MNTDNKTEQTKGVIEGLEDAANKYENGSHPITHLVADSFKEGAKWHHDTHYMPLVEELNKMKRVFYLNICRAYNAGKQSMLNQYRAAQNGDPVGDSVFQSSHDYFKGEFPEFETNVP